MSEVGLLGVVDTYKKQERLCNHSIAAVIVGNGAKVSIDIKEKAQFQIVWEIPSRKRYWPFRISLLYSLRQTSYHILYLYSIWQNCDIYASWKFSYDETYLM